LASEQEKSKAGRRARRKAAPLPGERPLRASARDELLARFSTALEERDGSAAAHVVHELWMRNEPPTNIERMLGIVWRAASESVPEWLPMRYVDWLPLVYEVAGRFVRSGRGKSNLYLVLLDYEDSPRGPFGVYVGATQYTPAARFDQHKSGIRAAGSVLRRGVEVLTGPVLHLQRVPRTQAAEIEEGLAEALRAEGLLVQGGH
jgi:hypothetical protein